MNYDKAKYVKTKALLSIVQLPTTTKPLLEPFSVASGKKIENDRLRLYLLFF